MTAEEHDAELDRRIAPLMEQIANAARRHSAAFLAETQPLTDEVMRLEKQRRTLIIDTSQIGCTADEVAIACRLASSRLEELRAQVGSRP